MFFSNFPPATSENFYARQCPVTVYFHLLVVSLESLVICSWQLSEHSLQPLNAPSAVSELNAASLPVDTQQHNSAGADDRQILISSTG